MSVIILIVVHDFLKAKAKAKIEQWKIILGKCSMFSSIQKGRKILYKLSMLSSNFH